MIFNPNKLLQLIQTLRMSQSLSSSSSVKYWQPHVRIYQNYIFQPAVIKIIIYGLPQTISNQPYKTSNACLDHNENSTLYNFYWCFRPHLRIVEGHHLYYIFYCHMKSTSLLLLFALITISTSTSEPNNITIDCEQCGAVACLNITGGPFDKFIYTTTNATCTDAGDFPTTYNFYCGPACPNCVVTPIYPNTQFQPTTNITAVGNCTTSSLGTPIITDLDTYYNALEMSTNQTYDWCSCPEAPQGISTGAFIGILCGIVGGWIVLGGTIWFFCCRNDSLNSYQEQK